MIKTKDIGQFLDESSYSKHPFHMIAKNHESINSEIEAYDYDDIKSKLVGAKCASADALYLKKHIYLFEFKTGFASVKMEVNIKTHKENLKLKIRLKAYESLALLEKIILPGIGDGILYDRTQKIYFAVVDERQVPMEAYTDILKSRIGNSDTFKSELFKNTLLIYKQEAREGKKLFYDCVEVWYDYEFDQKIKELA